MKSKTTTKTTMDNPAWSTGLVSGLANQATGLINSDPSQYLAKWNPYQQEAADRAANLGNNPWLTEATSMINLVGNSKTPSVSAASMLDGLDKYMSPYTGDVVDASLADYDFGAGQTRAAASADMARAGAFGGSRGAIAQSMTEDALTRGRGSLSAGLRDQAFTRGSQLSSEDAARRQQASAMNAQIALEKQGLNAQLAAQLAQMGFGQADSARSDIRTLLDTGNTLYDVNTQEAQAPLSLLSGLSGVAGSLPLGNWTNQTSTTKGGGGLLSGLGSLAMGVGSLASGGLLSGLGGLGGLFGGGLSGAGTLKNIGNAAKGIAY